MRLALLVEQRLVHKIDVALGWHARGRVVQPHRRLDPRRRLACGIHLVEQFGKALLYQLGQHLGHQQAHLGALARQLSVGRVEERVAVIWALKRGYGGRHLAQYLVQLLLLGLQ